MTNTTIELESIKVILGDQFADFQNWVRRGYFGSTGIEQPKYRGRWLFTRQQALEVALVAVLAKYLRDGKSVRAQVRAIFRYLRDPYTYDGARRCIGMCLNPASNAHQPVYEGELEKGEHSVLVLAKLLSNAQGGWVGEPRKTYPSDFVFVDFGAIRSKVDAEFNWEPAELVS